MSRNLFGGGSDDYTADFSGNPIVNRRIRFYTDATQTTEIVDIASDATGTGSPLTVTTNAYGYWGPVYGPDGVTVMYAGAVGVNGAAPIFVVAVYTHTTVSGGSAGVSSFNGRTGAVTPTKADVTGTGLAAADIGAVPSTQLGASNGVATLDGGGKIPTVQLPPLAINDTFTVTSQAAMLALTAQRGDAAVRTDLSPAETFMLTTDDPTQLVNWVQITTAGAVTSVFGRTGAVALAKADVTATGLAAADVGADASGAAAAVKGLPLALTGAAQPTRYVGGTTTGAPTSGTFAVGDFVTTADGNVFVCTAAGTPGTWKQSGSGAYAPVLVPTATKTANYTASPGDLVPVDTTSGSVTVTLPTAPVDGARVAVKQIVRGGTNTVTVAVGGSDHIATNNATSRTVTLLGEAVELQYQASTALWFIAASDTPVGQLDLRYGQLAAANEWQTMQTLDGGLTMGTPNGVSANVWFTSASQGWQGGPKWELGIDSSNNGGGLDFYFAKAAWRVILDGVLNSTTTLTSATAQFGTSDVGKAISGTGIPGGTTIASVTNATTVVLSAAATATATGVTVTVGTVNAVGDTIYVSNGAGNSPTVGIGVTPPSTTVPAAARLQVAGATADPTLDILKLLQASSSTGKYLKCTDSGGTDRLWVESDGTLRGAQNGIGGSLVIALPTGAATKALQVTNSGKTAVYGWDFASNTSTNSKIRYETGGFDLISFTSVGDVVVGNAALATGATGGFFWLPTVAGTPTGTPSSTFTGRTPMIVDTTGSKIWALISGTWKSVTLA